MTQQPITAPRRVPKQVRSRRMVARILKAAARIFAEEGYAPATTNRIAERAEVSVGSLYQFFPNKAALLLALRHDWMERVHLAMGAALAPEPRRPLDHILNAVVQAFEDLDRAEPGLLRVLMTCDPPECRMHADPAHEGVLRAITGQVEALLAARAPTLDPARRTAAAQLCVHISDALFLAPGPSVCGFDPRMVREVKAALQAYLAPLLGEV